MKTYGEVFHYLRTNKGMKLKELADEQLSISLIAQFEKNQSKLSYDRFIRLMNKLEVSLEEIQTLLEQSTIEKSYEDILMTEYQNITNSVVGYDKELFFHIHQQLIQKSQEIFTYLQKHPSLRLAHYYQFVLINNQMWYELTSHDKQLRLSYCQTKVQSYLSPIIRYLLSVDNWGVYEISLMNRFAIAMPIDLLMKLMNQATKRAKCYLDFPGNQEMIFNVFLTCFSVSLNLDAFDESKLILKKIRDHLKINPDTRYAMRLMFYESLLQNRMGNNQEGERLFQQLIETYNLIGLPELGKKITEERKNMEYAEKEGAFSVYIYIV
ncbi:Rgg/GadR/MutR family transcriptional regulator [Vagococcus xieshaowenii]|uniref:Rgg/GadR/MutR family transcriptional regulator n=1 Tax=Vagococcus xieshaowenii TaxID=2562451 RepID=A0AAJ5EE62_9ENTE|nr:Rgg/GadR/MutR family transcriptional regulator [Vagococcus xieshaowenii]QCA29035.1 Rgg/GadR/MutR family transcriptional regulator [Vagococcus xieshaowenii]TFZ40989.1 Rgg/GadR/MutR family transcriptional regulator [Vagococcus xieshaowenii]